MEDGGGEEVVGGGGAGGGGPKQGEGEKAFGGLADIKPYALKGGTYELWVSAWLTLKACAAGLWAIQALPGKSKSRPAGLCL